MYDMITALCLSSHLAPIARRQYAGIKLKINVVILSFHEH
jgi:hypothetical protein